MKRKAPAPAPKKWDAKAGDDVSIIREIFTRHTNHAYAKSFRDLDAADQWRLEALRWYHAARGNGFVLLEALELCTRHQVNPPAWILEALVAALTRYRDGKGVTLPRALALSGSDKNEYDDYRAQQPVMAEVRAKIARDPLHQVATACNFVAKRHGLHPRKLESWYREGGWRELFDYVYGENQWHASGK